MRWGVLLTMVVAWYPMPATAQRAPVAGPLAIGLSAERRGDLPQAVEYFRIVLEQQPTEGQAILGMSRVLPALDRRAELVPLLVRALASDSTNVGFHSLAVRTYSLLGEVDSARKHVERWAQLAEGEEDPYREWALSALEARDRQAAKLALETGRRRIAHPAALAPELAQLRQAEGDFAGATEEWIRAVTNAPIYRASAILMLGDLLPPNREVVLTTLTASTEVEARRLRGLLLTRWGQPEDGVSLLASVVPEDPDGAVTMLRMVFDQLKGRSDPAAQRARARALELQAERERGVTRVRTLMDAARAWADAGREQEARRLLARVASDPEAPAGLATTASSALLGVLLAEGKAAEAESLLVTLRPTQTMDDRDRDARRVAMAWARAGDIPRGERMLEADSSVAGFAMRGVLRLFAGDLALASTWLEIAGPYDDEREHSVERVRLLSLIQAIGRDSFPELGMAMLTLERGDTTRAVRELTALASPLEPPGAAAVRLLAGELALSRADTTQAMHLFEAADVDSAPAAAPAARFIRARVLAAQGRPAEAQTILEEIIIDFPDSAVVPAARRFRDALRGAVPSGAGR
jgi:tetratricopeptide (TPR) repeat protein